jgi:hypothetical protein
MTLRVEWTPETGADEPEVRTRDQNCTLNELEDWAIREFHMREVKETPEYIVISVDGVADETESVVANGAWVRMLTEARERHPDETETWVTCVSVTDEEAQGEGLEGSTVSNANEH